jgi:hypothetical protein
LQVATGSPPGIIISQGYNLVGEKGVSGVEGATLAASDIVPTVDIDAILAPLGDYGGPTQTHALRPNSVAINAIPVKPVDYCTLVTGEPLTTDQRGVKRPQGSACDIGAFEYDSQFSAFNVALLIIDQNRAALFLGWSKFTLGKGKSIDPVKEDVTLKIADFTMTIPAGSFQKNGYWPLFASFAGQIDNVWIEAFITPLGRNCFKFQALAYGAQLGDTKNPVTVELTIGDDGGTTTANAIIH